MNREATRFELSFDCIKEYRLFLKAFRKWGMDGGDSARAVVECVTDRGDPLLLHYELPNWHMYKIEKGGNCVTIKKYQHYSDPNSRISDSSTHHLTKLDDLKRAHSGLPENMYTGKLDRHLSYLVMATSEAARFRATAATIILLMINEIDNLNFTLQHKVLFSNFGSILGTNARGNPSSAVSGTNSSHWAPVTIRHALEHHDFGEDDTLLKKWCGTWAWLVSEANSALINKGADPLTDFDGCMNEMAIWGSHQ